MLQRNNDYGSSQWGSVTPSPQQDLLWWGGPPPTPLPDISGEIFSGTKLSQFLPLSVATLTQLHESRDNTEVSSWILCLNSLPFGVQKALQKHFFCPLPPPPHKNMENHENTLTAQTPGEHTQYVCMYGMCTYRGACLKATCNAGWCMGVWVYV